MHPLVSEYEARLAEFEALRVAAVLHMHRLLDEAGLNIHHVTSRVKKPPSLADKLRRKPGRHHALEDLTDLVGLRVITYFESDVNVVSKLVEAAYDVDWNNACCSLPTALCLSLPALNARPEAILRPLGGSFHSA